MARLGIEMVPAYSLETPDRSERAFGKGRPSHPPRRHGGGSGRESATESNSVLPEPMPVAGGETIEAAIAEAHDAFQAWTMAERQDRGELPAPKTYSGQFVQRIPKSLHRRLATRVAAEGMSLNQLAATYLAHGLVEG